MLHKIEGSVDGIWSHVAIPLDADDPVYGIEETPEGVYKGLPFGRLEPRGELGYLTVSLNQFMRLRYNPFFA
jgi:hypothetical protein